MCSSDSDTHLNSNLGLAPLAVAPQGPAPTAKVTFSVCHPRRAMAQSPRLAAPFTSWCGSLLTSALLVSLVACQGSVEAPHDSDGLGGACGPANCGGCCLGAVCTSGNAQSACGASGLACVECTGAELCRQQRCAPASAGCSPANCGGCCVGNVCSPGTAHSGCGKAGDPCVDCAASGGVCSAVARVCLDSCAPSCQGKCRGADDGCGGRCPLNDCKGCCVEVQCVSGQVDGACGQDGATCVDCTTASGAGQCREGVCSACSPDCTGRCKGASDGCGGLCKANECAGCCKANRCVAGTADEECGLGGIACSDCAQGAKTCIDGGCGPECKPDCVNRCKGEQDGCGGVCSLDTCRGCCDGSECRAGGESSACGKGAAPCALCPVEDDQGFRWRCEAGGCIKETPSGGACEGKDGGTTTCSEGGRAGRCWNGQCCTGCWDGFFSSCWNYVNGLDISCGDGGTLCRDCTLKGESCIGYRCGVASGPCGGVLDLGKCETASGSTGVCTSGHCCTTCYFSTGFSLACASQPSQTQCGRVGAACQTCEPFEQCDTSWGQCSTDPEARFEVIAVGATLRNLDGKVWDDTGGSAPDPHVGIVWSTSGCGAAVLDLCGPSAADTFTPAWGASLGIVKASTLLGEHCIFVLDSDGQACSAGANDEIIAGCRVVINDIDLLYGDVVLLSCPNPEDGKDYLSALRLRLVYRP